MIVRTVKELKEFLDGIDENLPIEGYDGTDRRCAISVYTSHTYASEEEKLNTKDYLIISTD